MMLKKILRKIKKYFTVREIYAERIPVVNGKLMEGRTALITGASSGIGFGIAQACVRQGCRVVLTGRREDRLIDACRKLDENGPASAYIVWDASNLSQLKEKFAEATRCFGGLDILVNNAGYHGNQNFWTISESDFDKTFDVNIKNVFFLSQAMAGYMRENHIKGNILNISSASSMKPAWSPYEISKWACRGFTRGLARELAPYGITVNGIAPGPSATEMSFWKEGDPLNWDIPKGRLGMPEEIGNLAVFLCSELGKNIIGETVFCDGGSGTLTCNK